MRAFETYTRWIDPMARVLDAALPPAGGESDAAYRMTIRAKALDSLRGLLPAATRSNVGIFGTGQGYEALLLRMRAHPLWEVRDYGALMLVELRKVIPAFLAAPRAAGARRGLGAVPGGDARGHRRGWRHACSRTRRARDRPEVTLTDFDPDGEVKVVAAAALRGLRPPDDQLLAVARKLGDEARREVLEAYVGRRENRRHKPGAAPSSAPSTASTCSALRRLPRICSAIGC